MATVGKPVIHHAMQDRSKRVRPIIKTGKGKTEQAHADKCDINHILRDYHKTGLIKHAAQHQGTYDDVTAVDFQNAMFLVTNAQKMFDSLPANIRTRFGNDPGSFLDFVQNPDNTDEMAKLGILKGNDGINVAGAQTGAPVEPPKVEHTDVAPPPSKPD